MFDIGLQEMVVIGVIALLVFGPSKLPELGRMVGRAMRELRRASDEFRTTVETNLRINEPDPVIATSPPPADTAPAPEAPLPSENEAALVGAGPAEGAPAGEGEAAAVEHGEPYVARRTARLFHRRDCRWVASIPELERVYLKRVADAREQGFTECPACEPWEPA